MKKTTRKTKSNSNDTQQAIEIQFQPPRQGAPENLLANVTLAFRTGLLDGLWMPGFALWRAERASSGERFISVTVPAKKVDGKYYDWLRGNQKKLKAVIVNEYERWLANQQASRATAANRQDRDPWDEEAQREETTAA